MDEHTSPQEDANTDTMSSVATSEAAMNETEPMDGERESLQVPEDEIASDDEIQRDSGDDAEYKEPEEANGSSSDVSLTSLSSSDDEEPRRVRTTHRGRKALGVDYLDPELYGLRRSGRQRAPARRVVVVCTMRMFMFSCLSW